MSRYSLNWKFIVLLAGLIIILCFVSQHIFYTYTLDSSVLRAKILNKYVYDQEQNHVKYILFWTSFFKIKNWGMESETYYQDYLESIKCPVTNCIFTNNKRLLNASHKYDTLIFHGAEAWLSLNLPATRTANQIYIMATQESPGEIKHSLNKDHDFYNLTMTYRLDSDVVFAYGSTIDLSTNSKIAPAEHVNWRKPNEDFYDEEVENITLKKTKTAAWFVSHCEVFSQREKLVSELQKFIDVDIYGGCGNLTCPQNSDACMNILEADYKFYFSFENTLCVDYVTEKVFKVMNSYIIPVVYSGAEMTRFIPPHSFVDANDFETPKDLADYLKYLSDNPKEYIKYFWWKKHYRVINEGAVDFCSLCKKLHEFDSLSKRQTYVDILRWYFNGACHKPKIKFELNL
ncbi:CLUMA_CG015321, isoform A [Clunio marinus]|uniref:Fucosyltransferase n=1 Tax=Clunio marinus TaxID=568069 RepID=A0A1J1IS09_9DIPT|nr:CLUMA_CG015321, isoform A [Clunio marinus]